MRIETKHNYDCNKAFGRLDSNCTRCQELKAGSPPRSGWQGKYYAKKKQQEEQQLKEIRKHNCVESKCGQICTFGDW